MTTILSAKVPGSKLPSSTWRRGRPDRSRSGRRSRSRRAAAHIGGRDLLAGRDLRGDEREGLHLSYLVLDAAADPVGVLADLGVAGERLDVVEDLLAAEDARLALLVRLGVGEDDLVGAGVRHRIDQGDVLLRLGRLEKLDVVGDRLRSVTVDRVDHVGMKRPGEWEPDRELVGGGVVDQDEDDVVARRLITAELEAGVDARQLRVVHQAGGVEEQRDAGRADGDRREQQRVRPAGDRGLHLLPFISRGDWIEPAKPPAPKAGALTRLATPRSTRV